ncbi:hypothetical protein AaE_008458 [Aphanomyces astaci]|uniref:Uncharacterized protein n=1 Tax=Aphanomyces astaci TaxID=112090 RepID=A0A6A5AFB1_APHAT|nr:hypothetical protein AaE_008458 [Aphanomyces astaci]
MANTYTSALVGLGSGSLRSLQNGAVGNLLLHIDQMKCAMQCSWLAQTTSLLYTSVCANLVGSTLTVSLCLFVMSVCLLPMIVMAVVLEKRLRGKTKIYLGAKAPMASAAGSDSEAIDAAKKSNGPSLPPATCPSKQV